MKNAALNNFLLALSMVLIVVLASPTSLSLAVGGVFLGVGVIFRIWAAGHLARNNEITTSGPYAYVRDPLYLGRLLIMLGLFISAWGYAIYVLPVAVLVFFTGYMPRKHSQEMSRLEQLFGDEYTRYAEYARSLLPKLKPYPEARVRSWGFDLFWSNNREQYFLLLVAIVYGLVLTQRTMPILDRIT
ncbi:MAG: hypothetical protein DHS20C01_14890 [marine bacterium B5-7]|nr:MAG: hypothetical protein DHS20C01_14890 [marine bacterium B5-7]